MIVGAGIVGTYLGAITGDMKIWESKRKLEEKACSGLLSVTGLKQLKLPYKEAIVNEVKGAEIYSENYSFTVKKRSTQAFVLDRYILQKQTLQMAEDNGCRILWNKKWDGEDDTYIIGADGALSKVAESMGIKRRYIFAYQIKAEYKTDSELVKIFLSKRYAPGFFAWIIPEDEKTSRIGIGVKEGNLRNALFEFLSYKGIKIKHIKKEEAGLIPIYEDKKMVNDNKALIGDAAAQVKATTGGGIIFACKAAHILKDAINRNDLKYYETEFKSKYGRDLEMHLKIRKMLNRVDYDALLKKLIKNNVPEIIEKYGDMDHPRKLVKQILMKPALWPLIRYVI